MKLLTLNCHSWQEENQIEKIKYLAKTIKEKSYDVIALQEVSQSINEKNVFNNIKRDNFALVLLRELEKIDVSEYKFIWDFSHIGYDVYEEGLALLTKHPITEKYSFFVSRSTDVRFWKTRKVVGAKILYYNIPISFYSCHFGWWDDKEEPFKIQVDNLIEKINKEEFFFLMGDFNNNAFIRGEGYDYLIDCELYDTYKLAQLKDDGITVKGKIAGWEKNKQDLRLDIILTNKPLGVKYSTVIFNGINKPIISDHFGVEIEI
ncbi:endonuclease/exonuclease/phosphatase family protein [Tepidibacter formicigenes]|jgi:maltose 6'-phosphate phosphatase|uniref:Maltose 6'-phosphate phosphatase n=1 Tax=Tepidibacter formicigenes DSM 15518 TaxID=1123349 RepID=A0A1M6K4G3_9FIRM|nr:endonuclease/exonuclease/phosphatase family protein [Tepidibacter formicigenes]SHJ53782.1 maltose 6'-phosphate phosphatase [Tepidibacter formicigenes DSM 15518]